jgi:hypothetical protein
MRTSVVATLLAVGLGLTGISVAQAAPAGGVAIGKAAEGINDVQQIRRFRRRRRVRRCGWRHRWNSRLRWRCW